MIQTNYSMGNDRLIGTISVTLSFEVNKWNEVDDLVHWLKTKHGGRTRKVAEGPDARTIVLSFADGELVIYQWDTGEVEIRAGKELADVVESITVHCHYGL